MKIILLLFILIMKTLLLPGGLGYIGSHTILQILQKEKTKIVVIDDYSNCQQDITNRLFEILTPQQQACIHVQKGNILDLEFLEKVFQDQRTAGTPIQGIIHFAAKKNATQSVHMPLHYFENNVVGSINLLKTMEKFHECTKFLFSSTAAVYGEQDNCTEQFDCKPISAYGQSKFCVEMLLKSLSKVHKEWRIISLRYFNPGGCHSSGKIGDWPSNYPGNLFPVIQEVIVGKRPLLKVYGNDWGTADGSGVRDYIHIVDLAQGHIKALERLDEMTNEYNYDVFNLGSGTGYSVFEVIKCFENALGHTLPFQISSKREGDMAKLVANVKKAEKQLGWKTRKTLQEMCDSCVKFTKETLCKHLDR